LSNVRVVLNNVMAAWNDIAVILANSIEGLGNITLASSDVAMVSNRIHMIS